MGETVLRLRPLDLYLSLFSLFSESFLGHGIGTNGFLGSHTEAWGTRQSTVSIA